MNWAAAPHNAATKLAAVELRKGAKLDLHTYCDASGQPLFWRIRCSHVGGRKWIRPMHFKDGAYVLGQPERPADGWPLYRLPELLAADLDTMVWLVEGESCADALAALGLLVTTSGGAESAAAADWTPLAGRKVRIWPDNDTAGRGYAADVGLRLEAIGCEVSTVQIDGLGLPEKGDCVDWLHGEFLPVASEVEALPAESLPARGPAMVQEKKAHDDAAADMPRAVLIRGDSIVPEAVQWLWPGWLEAGALHILAGQPGTGKTTIAMALAATLTAGGKWPDGTVAPLGDVVVWSGEDDLPTTLVPRLRAAGADMTRIHFVDAVRHGNASRPFDPATDIDALRATLSDLDDVRLLVVDPIVSAVAGDSHRNAEVRRNLQPLVDLAMAHGCALLGITHFSKGTNGRNPVERINGSLAFVALARLVMVTARQEARGDEPERQFLARAKANHGPSDGGFAYELRQGSLPDFENIETSWVDWGEALQGSATELLADAEAQGEELEERRDAASWLRKALEGTTLSVSEVKEQADAAGFAWRTVQRAMRGIGVESKRGGFGQSATWRLPCRATPDAFAPSAPHSDIGATGASEGNSALPRANMPLTTGLVKV